MHRTGVGLCVVVLAVHASSSVGCSDAIPEPGSQAGVNASGAGTGAGVGPTPAGLEAGQGGVGGVDASISAQGAGKGAAGEDAGKFVDGGVASDAGAAMDRLPPCDPNANGRVSAPGRYEGYSEAIYPDHERSSFYVEVRDGTRLAMDLFRPVDQDGALVETPLPVLWMHTPYNRRTFATGPTAETYPGFALRLVPHGYIVAIVDFRGLYASFGTNIAFNRGEWVDAARMDAYDITEWLAAQPWSSGKIGMWGCSATGGSQLQAATTAPPHLRAIFPMSCEFDVYPFAVPGGMAPQAGNTRTPPGGGGSFGAAAVDGPAGRRLLSEAAADHADNISNAGYAPYRDSIADSVGEAWWLKSSPHTYLDELNASQVAIYLAANWDEGATKHGAFFTFNNVQRPSKLLIGPAGHCEWTAVRQQTGFDLVVEELRFFDHWLKGIDNCVMHEPPVYYYTYNAPGDGFRAADTWPLPNERRTHYYLGDERLSSQPPVHATASDEATVRASTELVYTSEPLAEEVEVTGHPTVELWVSSTAQDGDFIVTLQEVAPDGGVSTYFMEGRLRASHRAVQDAPYDNLGLPYHPFTEGERQPLSPGEPTLLSFELLPISILFRKDHRIRVVVAFVDSVTPVPTPAPRVTIHRDATHPSAVVLPIIE